MLLRRSGELTAETYDLAPVTGANDGRIGVEDELTLLAIADAVARADTAALAELRAGAGHLAPQALVDAIGIASAFNGITKIANATGLPLDAETERRTVEMRAVTRIDDYSDAAKAARFDVAP